MARNLIIIIFSSIFILNCSDKNSDQQKAKDARDSFSKIDEQDQALIAKEERKKSRAKLKEVGRSWGKLRK